MSFSKEFENTFFNTTSRNFRDTGHTAFQKKTPTFEELVSQKVLRFETLEKKGIRVRAFREGEFQFENPFNISCADILSMIQADNPSIDLTFQQEYGSFVPDEGLLKPSNNPLWVVSKAENGVFRISRVWSK